MEIIIGIVLTVVLVVLLILAFVGTEVIYRVHMNLVNAMTVYALFRDFQDCIPFSAIREWELIDCICPWRWRYKYWLPKEEFNKIAPFLGR